MTGLKHRLTGFVRRASIAVLSLLCAFSISACDGPNAQDSPTVAKPETGAIAQANLAGTELNPDITGELRVEETADGLLMQGTFRNVPPGEHGFHIHEGESCADEGKAAGGHFNPRQVAHGYLPDDGFENAHAGDTGNVEAAEDGTVNWSLEVPGLAIAPGELSVANRAVILHAKPDDFGQPTGNAGDRIACGIIQ